jgi:hypothetical protein
VLGLGIPVIAGLCLLAHGYSRARQQRETAAMEGCKELVSRVDSYHASHGHYPIEMREVCDLSDAPVLVLDGSLHYSRTNDGFVLDIWNGFESGWRWSSGTRKWLPYD